MAAGLASRSYGSLGTHRNGLSNLAGSFKTMKRTTPRESIRHTARIGSSPSGEHSGFTLRIPRVISEFNRSQLESRRMRRITEAIGELFDNHAIAKVCWSLAAKLREHCCESPGNGLGPSSQLELCRRAACRTSGSSNGKSVYEDH